jgi:hypothetical protein
MLAESGKYFTGPNRQRVSFTQTMVNCGCYAFISAIDTNYLIERWNKRYRNISLLRTTNEVDPEFRILSKTSPAKIEPL